MSGASPSLPLANPPARHPAHPAAHPLVDTLSREAAVHYGAVPRRLGESDLRPGRCVLFEDEFVLIAESGLGYHYRRGHGVMIERPPGADPAEEMLWLNGSVYAAIASIHGLLPIHASAVAYGGAVHAFTGPSGAGKSTLVAALGRRGLPMFCDDTLVLDISDPARIMCLPGHKRLKLTPSALALTGAAAQEPVGAMTGKNYAEPPGGVVREVLPLARLTFLEEGDTVAALPVSGAERFARLNDDHYTAELFARARRSDLAARFQLLARLAPAIAMARLVRPRDASRFGASVDLAEILIREGPA